MNYRPQRRTQQTWITTLSNLLQSPFQTSDNFQVLLNLWRDISLVYMFCRSTVAISVHGWKTDSKYTRLRLPLPWGWGTSGRTGQLGWRHTLQWHAVPYQTKKKRHVMNFIFSHTVVWWTLSVSQDSQRNTQGYWICVFHLTSKPWGPFAMCGGRVFFSSFFLRSCLVSKYLCWLSLQLQQYGPPDANQTSCVWNTNLPACPSANNITT